MPSRPKILLVGLETNWVSSARLPKALRAAGFEVGVACRANAFLALTCHRDHFFRLPEKNHGSGLLAGLRTIVSGWKPDWVVPMDDWTTLFLTQVHEREAAEGDRDGLAALLRHSLGNPASTREALSKRRTMEAAQQLGVRVPANAMVESAADVFQFVREHGCPVVIKRSFSNSGSGVFICQNESEVRNAFKNACKDKTIRKRFLLWREQFRGRLTESAWLPGDQSITASQFIGGRRATSLAAAVGGKMLAVLTAEVEQTYLDDNGPSSVVRLTGNEDMREVSGRMLSHWGLTGLIGFDFILDESRRAWLLECNPRPTPLGHLGALVGEDLCVALYRGLSSMPVARAGIVKEQLVAHFPHELWRAPDSPYLKLAFHDVPSDDPALMEALKKSPAQRR